MNWQQEHTKALRQIAAMKEDREAIVWIVLGVLAIVLLAIYLPR